jgi:hypothetical protein
VFLFFIFFLLQKLENRRVEQDLGGRVDTGRMGEVAGKGANNVYTCI